MFKDFAPLFDLTPEFDSRKSFYGKAKVQATDGIVKLYSYDMHVATVDPATYTVTLLPRWNESATTLRHVKEFLKQHGLTAESKKQTTEDYA